jgi:hemolysin activation/secretion protein
LAEKLTAMYREKGYISSRVYVPPQTIEDGVVKIQAAEGLVGEINQEGGRWFSARAVTNRINLTEGEPFRLDRLKTSMIRINDNPDMQVKATLKAGEQEGTTDVELDVTDRFPLHVTPFYDNLGRRLIGEQRGGLNVAHNNVTGFGDRNLTSLNWSRRSFGVVNHYEMPLGKSGTKIGFDYGYSTLTLGGDFKELDVRGTAKVYSPFISHEFYTSDTLRISADLPFDFVNLKTTILGEDFNEDRLRVLRPSFTMESYDRWGNTFFRNEFGVGVNLFNATLGNTNSVSRQGAGSKFFRYTGFLTRTQKLPLGTYGVFRAITQLSPDRLVSNEQLQVGGAFTVRGYREGLLIGDSGLVLSGEWRVPFFVVPKSWKIPMTDYSLRENLQFVSFTDFGSSWTNRPAPGLGGSEYIMGVGMGIRARLTRFVVGRVDFAWPLLRPDRQPGVNPHNHPRLHFGLQSELF